MSAAGLRQQAINALRSSTHSDIEGNFSNVRSQVVDVLRSSSDSDSSSVRCREAVVKRVMFRTSREQSKGVASRCEDTEHDTNADDATPSSRSLCLPVQLEQLHAFLRCVHTRGIPSSSGAKPRSGSQVHAFERGTARSRARSLPVCHPEHDTTGKVLCPERDKTGKLRRPELEGAAKLLNVMRTSQLLRFRALVNSSHAAASRLGNARGR